MDLPEVDWFCRACWLHDDSHIPLVNVKVVDTHGDQRKADNLNIIGSTTAQNEIVKSSGKGGIERGCDIKRLSDPHKSEKIVKG